MGHCQTPYPPVGDSVQMSCSFSVGDSKIPYPPIGDSVQVSPSVSVGDCKTPETPIDGSVSCSDVNNMYKRCTVACDSGKAFLRPVPKFYSCGPVGVWNSNSPMNRFKFPPCGGKLDK